MKIRVEIDDNLVEDEVVIRAREYSPTLGAVQQAVSETLHGEQKMALYQQDVVFYIPYQQLLFFETEGSQVYAHTTAAVYQTRYRLYELLELLPGAFMRISKSTILNTNQVYSISNSLTATRIVSFEHSHKQVYVSRQYYKPLQIRLEEKRK